jgi:molecular chaperone DnaK (HSP70)
MTTVAIDFGTSNTLVSLLAPDTQRPESIQIDGITRLFSPTTGPQVPVIPSLVYVQDAHTQVVGEPVRRHRLGERNPQRRFRGFKRDLVAAFPTPPRSLDGVSYSSREIAEQFLTTIWQGLQPFAPSSLILTIPVGAFEQYLHWFKAWAMQHGIEQVQFVDESTAAALGYGVDHPNAIVLVVDFGGGTLDLSLVRTQQHPTADTLQAQVIAKADAVLGGEDVDIWIAEDYLQQRGTARESLTMTAWQQLLELSERLKIQLSQNSVASESWLDEETLTVYEVDLDRDRLTEILERNFFLEHLRDALDTVLQLALTQGVHKSDIEQVLLVGGSCLIPAVQDLITAYFGRSRLKQDQPFTAVCHGALSLQRIDHIDDYLHHSYAIRLWEPATRSYTYFTLFTQGQRYPCVRDEVLTLQVARSGQTEIRLDIGELGSTAAATVTYDEQGRMVSQQLQHQAQYRALEQHSDTRIATLNPPGDVGTDRITVQFEINEQRLLLATVYDLLTQATLLNRGAIAQLQ